MVEKSGLDVITARMIILYQNFQEMKITGSIQKIVRVLMYFCGANSHLTG